MTNSTTPTTYPKSSDVRKGELVTTFGNGWVGQGFLYQGKVWEPSGSYLARPAGETEYRRDGGAGYMAKVKSLFGG